MLVDCHADEALVFGLESIRLGLQVNQTIGTDPRLQHGASDFAPQVKDLCG
jgi:hypothetical protein